MNEVTVSGLVAKSDLRYTGAGTPVLKLRLAGTSEDRPHFLDVTVLGEQAERLADNALGKVLLVKGTVTQRKGQKGTFTNVLARSLRVVPSAQVAEEREAASVNDFTGFGFLAQDPEVRANGKLLRLRVAFNRRTKDGGSEAVFLPVDIWEGGEAFRSLKKGDQVYIEGSLRARTYTTASGEKRFELYVAPRTIRPVAWAGGQEGATTAPKEDKKEVLEEFPEDPPF
jgi:single-stranded DNA-binding protein